MSKAEYVWMGCMGRIVEVQVVAVVVVVVPRVVRLGGPGFVLCLELARSPSVYPHRHKAHAGLQLWMLVPLYVTGTLRGQQVTGKALIGQLSLRTWVKQAVFFDRWT